MTETNAPDLGMPEAPISSPETLLPNYVEKYLRWRDLELFFGKSGRVNEKGLEFTRETFNGLFEYCQGDYLKIDHEIEMAKARIRPNEIQEERSEEKDKYERLLFVIRGQFNQEVGATLVNVHSRSNKKNADEERRVFLSTSDMERWKATRWFGQLFKNHHERFRSQMQETNTRKKYYELVMILGRRANTLLGQETNVTLARVLSQSLIKFGESLEVKLPQKSWTERFLEWFPAHQVLVH